MKHSIPTLSSAALSAAACLLLGLAAPPAAAQTAAAITPPAAAPKPAEACQADLRTFSGQLEHDGYWLGETGYGYGYPVYGYYGYMGGSMMAGDMGAGGYEGARPGYEVRTLIASAGVLARHGQQQQCEDVLASARGEYATYLADLKAWKAHPVDMPAWRQREIAAAQPVAQMPGALRSDELLGTDVRNQQNQVLGSVEDLVMSPKTGKIAYLMVERGGLFGIGEKYVPVPWGDFKATPGVKVLVLDATRDAMKAAPEVARDQYALPGQFDKESATVDAYWTAHLTAAHAAN